MNWAANLSVRFRRAACRGCPPILERASGVMDVRSAASGFSRAARLAGGFNLFRRSHVRLRELYVLFCAGNLAFVPFR